MQEAGAGSFFGYIAAGKRHFPARKVWCDGGVSCQSRAGGARCVKGCHRPQCRRIFSITSSRNPPVVVEAMEAMPAGFTVSLRVEVKTGRTWADCE